MSMADETREPHGKSSRLGLACACVTRPIDFTAVRL